ncbi:hypothetical protein GALL_476320 [mine drainage metagenome]|uniref:Uncharacterized protein n=1 Tax=mine drainage metagenome TaxID=410659 RepID=A0A1J5PT27_9ZZZZ
MLSSITEKRAEELASSVDHAWLTGEARCACDETDYFHDLNNVIEVAKGSDSCQCVEGADLSKFLGLLRRHVGSDFAGGR